jgi:hypothetical protein
MYDPLETIALYGSEPRLQCNLLGCMVEESGGGSAVRHERNKGAPDGIR